MRDTLQRIHDKMGTLLGRGGAFIDALYVCPHHPDSGFPGERPCGLLVMQLANVMHEVMPESVPKVTVRP